MGPSFYPAYSSTCSGSPMPATACSTRSLTWPAGSAVPRGLLLRSPARRLPHLRRRGPHLPHRRQQPQRRGLPGVQIDGLRIPVDEHERYSPICRTCRPDPQRARVGHVPSKRLIEPTAGSSRAEVAGHSHPTRSTGPGTIRPAVPRDPECRRRSTSGRSAGTRDSRSPGRTEGTTSPRPRTQLHRV